MTFTGCPLLRSGSAQLPLGFWSSGLPRKASGMPMSEREDNAEHTCHSTGMDPCWPRQGDCMSTQRCVTQGRKEGTGAVGSKEASPEEGKIIAA